MEQISPTGAADPLAWSDSNPLLEGVLKPMGHIDWGNALFCDPSADWPAIIPSGRRLLAIEQISNVYVPRFEDVDAAVRLHLMLVNSLIQRDPRLRSNKVWVFHAFSSLYKTLDDIPQPPFEQMRAQGAILQGPSGGGKTAFRQRFTNQFAQRIDRPRNEACGWYELKQLIWLCAEMPADGSRSSLCESIARAMDQVLGTTYAAQIAKVKGVDSQLVHIVHWLGLHKCGMLFIEESQDGDLSTPVIGRIFRKFFLRLLNSGTPVVLMGNPLAFDDLLLTSQDLSRFTEGGDWHFYPEMSWMTDRWINDLMPKLWGFTVFGANSDPMIEELTKVIWCLTGGSPSYLRRLRRETLLCAVLAGRDRVDLAALIEAIHSTPMIGVRPIISAYVKRDPVALTMCSDQPVAEFERRWAELQPWEKNVSLPDLGDLALDSLYPQIAHAAHPRPRKMSQNNDGRKVAPR